MAAQEACLTPYDVVGEVMHHLQTFFSKPNNAVILGQLRDRITTSFRPHLDGPLGSNASPPIQALGADLGLVFFGTTALRSVTLVWYAALLHQYGQLGRTWTRPNGKVAVALEPYPERGENVQGVWLTRTDHLLSVLMHECGHALMFLKCCAGRCGRDRCRQMYQEQVGLHHHGDAFIRLSAVVERFAQQQGLWRCNLKLKMFTQRLWVDDRAILTAETAGLCWPREQLTYWIFPGYQNVGVLTWY